MRRFFRQYGRLVLALAAVLALCAALPALFQQSRAIETGSWGLSFRTEGKAPVGNASAEALRRYDAVYLGNEAEQKIYLTFDAGYENGCTEPILDALAKHNGSSAITSSRTRTLSGGCCARGILWATTRTTTTTCQSSPTRPRSAGS